MDFLEWAEQIWKYAQEHWTALLIGAVVLLVLLVCIFAVHVAKRSKPETVPEAEPGENTVPEQETAEEPEFTAEPEVEAEPKIVFEPEFTRETEPQPVPETKPKAEDIPAAQGLMEHLLRSAEEVSRTTGEKVESIELKIEKAQLTIHYAGGKKETVSEENVESEEMESSREADFAERRETGERLEIPKRNDGWKEKEGPKKFGADNMNKTRSGRVYSEEELRNQIKD